MTEKQRIKIIESHLAKLSLFKGKVRAFDFPRIAVISEALNRVAKERGV